VNRLYYACFYTVSALLLTENLSSSKHTGVRSLFNNNFVKKNIYLKSLDYYIMSFFKSRHSSDYEDFVMMKEDFVCPWIDKTRIFLDTIKTVIEQKTG
jgi:uncharacterized protein (UPF0332 family)